MVRLSNVRLYAFSALARGLRGYRDRCRLAGLLLARGFRYLTVEIWFSINIARMQRGTPSGVVQGDRGSFCLAGICSAWGSADAVFLIGFPYATIAYRSECHQSVPSGETAHRRAISGLVLDNCQQSMN